MKKGFTLIELLVVVLIMGILASVALPQYFKSVEKSRSAEAITLLRAWADAQERHYMKTGSYNYQYNSSNGIHYTDLDINIPELSYYEIEPESGSSYLLLTRKGGSLYGTRVPLFQINLPTPPGSGKTTWKCGPKSAGCMEWLPTGDSIEQGAIY